MCLKHAQKRARKIVVYPSAASWALNALRTWLSRQLLIARILAVSTPRLAPYRATPSTAIGIPSLTTKRWG
jgi:hypothetical protein